MHSCTTRRTTATRTQPTCRSSCRCSTRRVGTDSRSLARPTWPTSATPRRPHTPPMPATCTRRARVIFPCVKVQSEYRDIEDIIRMCRVRIRVPDMWWGDYLALLGSARVGERELLELASEIGWDRLDEFVEAWFDYSEGRMAEAIGAAARRRGGRDHVSRSVRASSRRDSSEGRRARRGRLHRGRFDRQRRLPAVRTQHHRVDRPLSGHAGGVQCHQRRRAAQTPGVSGGSAFTS